MRVEIADYPAAAVIVDDDRKQLPGIGGPRPEDAHRHAGGGAWKRAVFDPMHGRGRTRHPLDVRPYSSTGRVDRLFVHGRRARGAHRLQEFLGGGVE